MKNLLGVSLFALFGVLSAVAVPRCPCLSSDCKLRLLSQCDCICDGVSSNYCFKCKHLAKDCPAKGRNMGANFKCSSIWAVYDHLSDKVVAVAADRSAAVDLFFEHMDGTNYLDLVRYDLSIDYLNNSIIFVHK